VVDGQRSGRPINRQPKGAAGRLKTDHPHRRAAILTFSAVAVLPLADATGLSFTAPLFMTGLSALVLRERVGAHRWTAVILGFAGVAIMTAPSLGDLNLRGALLGLIGALGAAGAMIAIREMSPTERSSTIVFYFTVLGGPGGGRIAGRREAAFADGRGASCAGLPGGAL
jgi:hypothetical protein